MVGAVGFEPTTLRLKVWYSSQLSYTPIIYLAHPTGFEPVLLPWKGNVLTTRRWVHRIVKLLKKLNYRNIIVYQLDRFVKRVVQIQHVTIFTTGATGQIRTDGFKVLQTFALGHSATVASTGPSVWSRTTSWVLSGQMLIRHPALPWATEGHS